MVSILIQILVGIAGGIAAGLQAPFSGLLGQRVGDMGSVLITYGGGGVLIIVLAVVTGQVDVSVWRTIPWYAFLTGPLGLVIIGAISYTVPRMGTVSATALAIVSWLTFSAIVDHFGWFETVVRPIDITRIIGILALVAGTWLVIR